MGALFGIKSMFFDIEPFGEWCATLGDSRNVFVSVKLDFTRVFKNQFVASSDIVFTDPEYGLVWHLRNSEGAETLEEAMDFLVDSIYLVMFNPTSVPWRVFQNQSY